MAKAAILAASRVRTPIVSKWRPQQAPGIRPGTLISAINARDRIGSGPGQNAKGVVIARNVDDLHSANNKLSRETALTARGTMGAGVGFTPVWHDALTGSDRDGRAFPDNMSMTCNNWSSGEFGKAMLRHTDRTGLADNDFAHAWNSTHQSRGCSQADLIATGGNGLFYCFAQ